MPELAKVLTQEDLHRGANTTRMDLSQIRTTLPGVMVALCGLAVLLLLLAYAAAENFTRR